MNDLIERIGIPMLIQMVIESWNSVFMLIMIFSIVIGKRSDKSQNAENQVKIPLTNEIITFYISISLYNFFDILCVVTTGDTRPVGMNLRQIGEFGYFSVGTFQVVFLLELFKWKIAQKNGFHRLKKVILLFQLLQIPYLILLMITPFTGALYYFDEQNYYHRGQFYEIPYYITVISFALMIGIFLLCRKKIDHFLRQVTWIAFLIPLIAFFCNFTYTGISFNNISVSLTALIVYILYEKHKTAVMVQNAHELEQAQTELAESRLALEQSKNETLMAQIQPHFIYNALMAIEVQCIDKPDVYRSIGDFSRYLRSHFESIGDTTLITFAKELRNIKAYLSLEQLNFKEKLRVEYEIESDDFMIPALSVEPLVENAVRHGIGTYEQGGVVKIIVREENAGIVIEVIDEGYGKHNITEKQEKRKGIGVQNVRARLKAMSKGELDIISGEHGTCARITLAEIQYEERQE